MLLREYGKIAFSCDGCGDETKAFDSEDFDILRDWAKEHDWKTVKEDGQWCHYCSECR